MAARSSYIGLDVRTKPMKGYTKAKLANQKKNPNKLKYYYKYLGGSDGKGNVKEGGRKPAGIFLTLVSDVRYAITKASFHPRNKQLFPVQVDHRHLVILDVNTKPKSVYYKVQITDASNGYCKFWCDPRVTNTD